MTEQNQHSELVEQVRAGIVRPVEGVPAAVHPYRPTARARKQALAALKELAELVNEAHAVEAASNPANDPGVS